MLHGFNCISLGKLLNQGPVRGLNQRGRVSFREPLTTLGQEDGPRSTLNKRLCVFVLFLRTRGVPASEDNHKGPITLEIKALITASLRSKRLEFRDSLSSHFT